MPLTGDVYAIELLVFPNDNPMAHLWVVSGETPLVSSLMAVLRVNMASIHKGVNGEKEECRGAGCDLCVCVFDFLVVRLGGD